MTSVKEQISYRINNGMDRGWSKIAHLIGKPLDWHIWAKTEVPVNNQVRFSANQVENRMRSKMS